MGSVLSSVKYTPDGLPYYNLNDIKNLDKLDEGGYGTVMKGVGIVMQKTGWTPPDPETVMKTYHGMYGLGLPNPTEVKKKRVLAVKLFSKVDEYSEREIQILKMHSHPHIIELFGVIWNGKPGDIERSRYTGYVMEYMKLGSLHNEIHCLPKIYDLKLITTWIHQIAEGLEYLHENGIIHRDLKPKNILLAARDHLKLADFGLARNVSTRNTNTSGYIGTEVYRAPEVLNSRDYGPPADVYSFGVTIWEIVTRKYPIEQKIVTDNQGNISLQLPMEPDMDEGLINLIEKCLQINTSDRPSVDEIRYFEPNELLTILIVGGTKDRAEKYNGAAILNDLRYGWLRLPEILPYFFEAQGNGIVYLAGEIYIIGGKKQPCVLYKLDKNLNWIRRENMNIGRNGITNSCLVWKGYIWVFGGNMEGDNGRTVERYDPKEDKWTLMPKMLHPRIDAAATIWNDSIIISGGHNGWAGTNTNTIECFNLKDGIWTELPNMPCCVSNHSLVSYKKKLLVIGGYTDRRVYNNVWQLDPHEDNAEWRPLTSLKFALESFAGIVLDKEIYAIGGLDKECDCVDRIEIFDGEEWHDGPTLPYKWSEMSALLIPQDLAHRLLKSTIDVRKWVY